MTAAVIALRAPNSAPALSDAQRKQFATWQAEFAMCGVPLERLADGSFMAETLFGLVPLKDLGCVVEFARQLGIDE